MPTNCPHCGAKLSAARDAFCSACFCDLDELPDEPVEPGQDAPSQGLTVGRIMARRRGMVVAAWHCRALGAEAAWEGLR